MAKKEPIRVKIKVNKETQQIEFESQDDVMTLANLLFDWKDIIEFVKTTHINGQPKFNQSISAIGKQMEPLYNHAKYLFGKYLNFKID